MIRIFRVLGICMIIFSCGKRRDGFFKDMPNEYSVDSLVVFKCEFENLYTKGIDDGNSLYVNSNNCLLIPFCGYLLHRNDTIYYSSERDDSLKYFLFLKAKRFEKHIIRYNAERVDEVTYIGKVLDKKSTDSLALFMLKPVKRMAPNDMTYLKFIAIKKGGLRYFTFSNSGGDYTIELSDFPMLINEIRYR